MTALYTIKPNSLAYYFTIRVPNLLAAAAILAHKGKVHMKEVFVLGRGCCAVLAFVVLFTCSGGHAQPRIKAAQPGVWSGFPSGHAWSVRVSGDYAYIAVGQDGLAVIDVSDPTRPIPV